MQTQKYILLALITIFLATPFATAIAIENDPAKEYRLNETHGPWMIMVATFRDVQDPRRKEPGMTARDAANQVIHELRSKGIPAYAYSQDAKKEQISTYDRLGNKDKRVINSQLDMVCVLAGNYPKIEDSMAQKTLGYVKKYRPKFMADPKKSGAVVNELISQQKGPFAGAFLTINPTLNPTEVVRRKADDETKFLNSGIDYPLVKVPHKYTLKVATFTGKSVVPMGNSRFKGQESEFDKSIFDSKSHGPYSLARAGEDATGLTYTLRENATANRVLGRDRFEAYVYHDKYQSIVTIGGFDSPNDPEIKRLADVFKAKYKSDKPGGGEYLLISESLSLPADDPRMPPLQTWAFDPEPELIEIPRIK